MGVGVLWMSVWNRTFLNFSILSNTTFHKNIIAWMCIETDRHYELIDAFLQLLITNAIKGLKCKCKCKVCPRTGFEGPEENQRYSSTLYLTSVLHGCGWSKPSPDRFIPGTDTRYPLCGMLGWPCDWSGGVRKTSPPPRIDPWTDLLAASSYIDWVSLATVVEQEQSQFLKSACC